MVHVNMHEAKTHLSRYVKAIQSGAESEVIIANNGVPAARLVPIVPRQKVIIGIAKGEFEVPDDIDSLNPEIARMFCGEED